jgi:alpha-1,2-mannosyltransferase
MFSSETARRLWLLFALDALLVTGFLVAIGSPTAETIIRPLDLFLEGVQGTDSWRPMQTADEYLHHPHELPVYDAMLVERGVKFQYPLSSLLLTRGLSLDSLNRISWLSVLVVAVSVWLTLWKSARQTPFEFQKSDVMLALAVIALTVTFYPLVKAYALGQVQAWISGLFAIAIVMWVFGREDVSGLAIGIGCLIKPTYLFLAIWGSVAGAGDSLGLCLASCCWAPSPRRSCTDWPTT